MPIIAADGHATKIQIAFLMVLVAMLATVPFAAKPVIQSAGVILTGLVFCALATKQICFSFPKIPTLLIGGMIALGVISVAWSLVPMDALQDIMRLIGVLLAGLFLITYAHQVPPCKWQNWTWLAVGLLAGIIAIIVIQHTDYAFFRWWRHGGRVYDFVTNKAIGALTLLTPAILVPLFYTGTKRWRLIAVAIAVMGVIAIAGSEGQSSLLAWVVMILAAAMPLQSKIFMRGLRALIIVGMLGAPFIVMFLFSQAVHEINQYEIMRQASAAQRLEVWNAIGEKIMERPSYGYGLDATNHIGPFNSQEIYQPGKTFSHPHNMAMQLWLEFGAIGAVWGAVALSLILRTIWKVECIPARRLYFMSFMSTLVIALVGWGMWQVWWMTLVFLVVAVNVMAGRLITHQLRDARAT